MATHSTRGLTGTILTRPSHAGFAASPAGQDATGPTRALFPRHDPHDRFCAARWDLPQVGKVLQAIPVGPEESLVDGKIGRRPDVQAQRVDSQGEDATLLQQPLDGLQTQPGKCSLPSGLGLRYAAGSCTRRSHPEYIHTTARSGMRPWRRS